MDTVRDIIKVFIKIAFALFFFAFVWWLVSLLFPSLSYRDLISFSGSKSTSTDILPSPRKFSGLFSKTKIQDENTNLFVAPPAFNGYDLTGQEYTYSSVSYITYTSTGTVVRGGSNDTKKLIPSSGENVVSATDLPVQSPNALLGTRNLTVRNLSIFEGGHVYTGLSFIGEAKSTMFREGKFPIVIIDHNGKFVGVSAAVATTNWTVPGWTRFETKIQYALPNGTPCTMIFEEALTQAERSTHSPLRVPLAVMCN